MHFTLCTSLYALDSMHCALCPGLYALRSIHCALCTSLHALRSMHFILCTSLYALHSMHFTLCTSLCALHSMHFTLCTSLYALHCMYFTLCCWVRGLRADPSRCFREKAHRPSWRQGSLNSASRAKASMHACRATHHEVVNAAKRQSVNSVLRMRHTQTAQDAFSCILMS